MQKNNQVESLIPELEGESPTILALFVCPVFFPYRDPRQGSFPPPAAGIAGLWERSLYASAPVSTPSEESIAKRLARLRRIHGSPSRGQEWGASSPLRPTGSSVSIDTTNGPVAIATGVSSPGVLSAPPEGARRGPGPPAGEDHSTGPPRSRRRPRGGVPRPRPPPSPPDGGPR